MVVAGFLEDGGGVGFIARDALAAAKHVAQHSAVIQIARFAGATDLGCGRARLHELRGRSRREIASQSNDVDGRRERRCFGRLGSRHRGGTTSGWCPLCTAREERGREQKPVCPHFAASCRNLRLVTHPGTLSRDAAPTRTIRTPRYARWGSNSARLRAGVLIAGGPTPRAAPRGLGSGY